MKKNKLPNEFKTKWIEALKSGRYPKGSFRLKTKEGEYCCLGVAAEIQGCKNLIGNQWIGGKSQTSNFSPIVGYTKVPKILHGNDGIAEELSILNDNNESFDAVIEYIEEKL